MRSLLGASWAALAVAGLYARRQHAVAIEQWRLSAEATRRARDAAAARSQSIRAGELLRITDAALAALPLDELFQELLRRVCRGLPADAAALLLTEAPLQPPGLRAAHGFEAHGAAGTLLPGVGLAARVTEERQPVGLLESEVEEVRLTALRDMRAVAGAPLSLGSQVIGVLEVGRREAVAFDAEDLGLLQLAADRTALAVDHGRIFERERYIAETLQRSLLPSQMPEIPGIELEARFVPAGRGQQVGGDFYDVVGLGEDQWLLVVGDVCGKGPEAAALTAMVRYTLRAEAAHEQRPAKLLELLNHAILTQRSDYLFCTAVCVRLDLHRGGAVITLAGGGHPMPLIRRAGGRVEPPPAPGGPLIGVYGDAMFEEQRYSLLLGDSLIIYTDGLLEAHAPERILTPEALAVTASELAEQPLAALLRALENAALGSSIEPVRDDIATLAFSLVPNVKRRHLRTAQTGRRVAADVPPDSSRAPQNPQSSQRTAHAGI